MSIRILVAEDDRSTQLRLSSWLERWGYEVLTVDNGDEALRVLREEGIQFVISDWMMPGLSGPALVRKIREGAPGPYVYFMLLTSKSEQDYLVKGMEAGADDFLAKPFDPAELRVRVRAGERLLGLEDSLLAKNRELSAFTSVASHDLREPLRTISSFLMLLERKYGGQLDEQADEYIQFITDAAKRMTNLISDLLDYAKVDSGEEEYEAVDTGEVCRDLLAGLKVAIEESGATIEIGELPVVQGNRTQLSQVFQNLVGNGIKYRGEAAPVVKVEAQAREGGWLFTVCDNGIGIPEDQAKAVFEPFCRLHGVSSEYKGSGVGLAICQKVVEKHGGEIWVEPNPAGGSIFSFTLPAPDPGA